MQRILITGAAKRLGRIMALRLAGPERMIAVHYRRSEVAAKEVVAEIETFGGKAICVQADLENTDEAKGLIEKAVGLAGGLLTGLINNASVFDYDSPEAVDACIMKTAFAVNTKAPIILSAAFYGQAKLGVNNVIINLLDQKLWNLNPDFFSYTNSKMALRAATDMMVMKYEDKVRVNAIAPGLLFPSFDQSEEEFSDVASRNALQTPIDPQQVAEAATYIFESHIKGQVIHVDNGQRFVKLERDVMFETRCAEGV